MSQPTTKRPPQVSLAGTVVIAASVFVVLDAWNRVATLRTLDSRARIERILESPTWAGTGLDVEGVMRLIHGAGLVAAACAAATAILGWFVLRRDTSARLALALLAVPLFVSGLVMGGLASSFVAAGAAMLWLSPAREWFATGRWTPPPPRQPRPTGQESRASAWPPAPPAPDSDRPAPGAGAPPAGPPQGPAPGTAPGTAPYGAAPYGQAPAAHPWNATAPERPRAVVTAVVLATVMSLLVALMMALVLVGLATSPELLGGELERQLDQVEGLTLAEARAVLMGLAGFCLLLCVLALSFAGFLTLGREWARWGLMLTAAFTVGVCLLVAIRWDATAVLPGAAAVVTVSLLRRPEARAWCQERGAARRG